MNIFRKNDRVKIMRIGNGTVSWLRGSIARKSGPAHYVVKFDDGTQATHRVDHLYTTER